MTTDETPISYEAAQKGTPVVGSSGTSIGTLEHVLEVPELDLFDGLVIGTHHGLRFVDADKVGLITASQIRCELSDAEIAGLPAPAGAPVFHVDALAESGHNLHDVLGRFFGRPHWTREHD